MIINSVIQKKEEIKRYTNEHQRVFRVPFSNVKTRFGMYKLPI